MTMMTRYVCATIWLASLVLASRPASAQVVINPAPVPTCADGDTLLFDGSTWGCSAAGVGTVTGSGTTGTLPKFSAGTTLADSIVSESGGAITIAGPVTASKLTVTGTVTAQSNLSVGGTLNSSGALNMFGAAITTTLNPAPGVIAASFTTQSTIVEASSGTHSALASAYLVPPTITGGSATVSNTATLLVHGAPSATVSGGNYSIYADAGIVRFGAYGAGTATFDSSGTLSSSSDERLKNIDGSWTVGLDQLRLINPIKFHWKYTEHDTLNAYYGFSAQNVLAAIPEAIGQDPDGFYSINTTTVLAAAVNAIKELSDEIDELRAKQGLEKRAKPTPIDATTAATRIAKSPSAVVDGTRMVTASGPTTVQGERVHETSTIR